MWWRLDPTPEHQESMVIGCSVQTAGNFRPSDREPVMQLQLETTGPGDSWGVLGLFHTESLKKSGIWCPRLRKQ